MKETIYNGKKLNIDDLKRWTYDGIQNDKILSLNSELHLSIQEHVDYYLAHETQIEEEKEKQAKIEMQKKVNVAVAQFKKHVESTCGSLLKGHIVEYMTTTNNISDGSIKQLTIDGKTTIEYDNTVWHSGAWNSSKTNMVWQFQDFEYHKKRFVKLESAVKKAIELIQEKKENDIRHEKETKQKENTEQTLETYAKVNGFKFEKFWHSTGRSGRFSSNRGYYKYRMFTNNVAADLRMVDNKVVIDNYTVLENVTLEAVKKVM